MIAPEFKSAPMENARAAWGDDLPDWVEWLAQECAATSQGAVARILGRNPSLVSQILHRKYAASYRPLEELVRGRLMREMVQCPARQFIPKDECQDWRKKAVKFSGHNSERVRMMRACRRCAIFRELET